MSTLKYTYRIDGIAYKVTLDVDAICKRAAWRAHRSNAGKCALLKGAVKAKPAKIEKP